MRKLLLPTRGVPFDVAFAIVEPRRGYMDLRGEECTCPCMQNSTHTGNVFPRGGLAFDLLAVSEFVLYAWKAYFILLYG